jgi:hypothetical protein
MKKVAVVIALGLALLAIANSTEAYARRTRLVISPMLYGYGYAYRWYDYGWYRYGHNSNHWAHFSAARYIECRKKVTPERFYSPALIIMIDACYLGLPW